MRKKVVGEKYSSVDVACHWYGEEQIKKMAKIFTEPEICPKCTYSKFIQHEDGYQCINCFKIVYIRKPSDNGNGNRHRKGQLILI